MKYIIDAVICTALFIILYFVVVPVYLVVLVVDKFVDFVLSNIKQTPPPSSPRSKGRR